VTQVTRASASGRKSLASDAVRSSAVHPAGGHRGYDCAPAIDVVVLGLAVREK